MTVEIVTGSTPELVEAMGRLIPQLSRSAPALTAAECEALVAQNGVYLFIFRSDESLEGCHGMSGNIFFEFDMMVHPHRASWMSEQ